MDNLPVEIVAVIFEYLREWNTCSQPFSYLTETSQSAYVKSDQYDGWLVHTTASRENICSFRLVGHKYQSSSLSAFGAILGNKIFHLTRVGLDDLDAISRVAALRPYIDTLTFGSAQFADPDTMENLWTLLSEPDRTRLRATYTSEYEWQTCNGHTELHQRFEAVLNALPKLHSLRLHAFDNATNRNPLAGWLTGNDYQLIRETWDELVTKRILEKCHVSPRDLSAFAPIFGAITSTAKDITDLRFAPKWSVDPPHMYTALKDTSMVSHLRFVRFDLEWRWLPNYLNSVRDVLPKAFGHFVDVTHLTINIWKHSLTRDDMGRKSLLHMLSSIKQLKQFIIGGHCHFQEDELVEFVARHAETLDILALKRPIMTETNGSWTSTARRILQLSFPALVYLELFEMRKYLSHREFPPAFEDGAEWGEFLFAVQEVAQTNAALKLLSELEITTVRYVSSTLRPLPTIKISSEQPPSLPQHILLLRKQRERRRAMLERMQQLQQLQQIV